MAAEGATKRLEERARVRVVRQHALGPGHTRANAHKPNADLARRRKIPIAVAEIDDRVRRSSALDGERQDIGAAVRVVRGRHGNANVVDSAHGQLVAGGVRPVPRRDRVR